MGMDVFGRKPKDKTGEYFRANVWYWHPLWECIENLHPIIALKVEFPHENSGDGLGARDSIALARLLKKDIDNGTIEKYIADYYAHLDSLPDQDCDYCDETGHRIYIQDGLEVLQKCGVCKGEKQTKNWLCNYHMNIEVFKKFQAFLETCGGFNIYQFFSQCRAR